MILSRDPVDSTSFLQCFPEKAYGSNSRSCAVLQTRSLQRPPFFKQAYLNPLIPYLGKKIFRGSDWSAEKPQHCSQHIKRSYTLLGDKLLVYSIDNVCLLIRDSERITFSSCFYRLIKKKRNKTKKTYTL